MGKHRIAERTCMGCGKKAHKAEFLRFVFHKEEEVSFDVKQNKPGRGGYLCPKQACFSLAGKKRKKMVRLHRATKINPASLISLVGDQLLRDGIDGDGREGERPVNGGSSTVSDGPSRNAARKSGQKKNEIVSGFLLRG